MTRVGSLVVALSKDWLRNREAVFFALLFPVILLVIFSTVFAGGPAEFTVHVQNNDRVDGEPTNLSAAFVESLAEPEPLTVRTIPPGRNVSAWSRENGTGTTRVVVIPDGFGARVRNSSIRARIAVIRDTVSRARGQMNASQRARVQTGLGQLNATAGTVGGPATVVFRASPDDESAPAVRGIVESVVTRFNERAIGVEDPPVTVATADLGTGDVSAVDYYLPAFIAAIVMINGVITVTTVVAGFGHDGTLKRLAATPLRRRDWILANVVHQSLVALLLLGVMVAVAHLLFAVTVIPGPLSVALVVVGAAGFTALGIALGSFLRDPDAATSLGNAIALPMMFLSGVFWELELMPAVLQTLAKLLPLYYFHLGLRRLMVLETTEGVLLPFAVLGAVTVVCLVLAVRATRWRDFD